jgi:diguanylate cyclase (GGDEF)-like protein
MIDMIVSRYRMEFRNIVDLVNHEVGEGDLVAVLGGDPELRRRLETSMRYFRTPEVVNLFFIYQDAKGRLRYLLDSETDPSQKALFRQRFIPVSDIWAETFVTKRGIVHRHERDKRLWMTLTLPLIRHDKVVAVLGSDLSAEIRSDVARHFDRIKMVMLVVALLSVVLLILGYVQVFYYYRGRNRSFYDPLTHAYNRKFLYEVLGEREAFREYQLVMYDIDHFKRVNDEFGHEMGDRVLQELTNRVQHILREEDLLVRFGGEEFLIFLKTDKKEMVVTIASRIKKSVETAPFVIGQTILSVTISMGVNDEVEKAENLDDAIEVADGQLYCAKHAGRNRICVKGKVIV